MPGKMHTRVRWPVYDGKALLYELLYEEQKYLREENKRAENFFSG